MSPGPDGPADDRTQHRAIPRPGAGRAGSADLSRTQAPPGGRTSPATAARPAAVGALAANADLREFIASSTNRLLNIAMPLIALIGRLRTTVAMPNVSRVRQHAVTEVRTFEEELAKLRYPQDIASDAHYVLCAAVDQAVLSTPWGLRSEWASQGLRVTFHQDAGGGSEFFDVLKRVSADPARNIDLLELQYVCLCLGFAGMYQDRAQGPAQLLALRDEAYRRIRDIRGVPDAALSVHWEGEHDRRHRLVRYVPLWVVAAAAGVIVLVCFLAYSFALHRSASPIRADLLSLAVSHPDYSKPAQAAGPHALTLKQLLSPEVQAHLLTVEDTDKGALVSLIADDLFASGSATLNSRYTELVHKVAAALNQVPGRVEVIGHTDDQPIRSLRFADNVELSRARAVSVKNLLTQTLSEPARVNWSGLGSSAPKYVPADLPQNRNRNRRIEILLRG
jgi:type VI secretion system protein ImpK